MDGLRGLAVLLVVCDHGELRGFDDAGGVGVTVFFALSGYLITGMLLAEHARTGRISLRSFYVRRARRLLPALFVLLGVTILVWGRMAVPSSVATVLYVANLPAASEGAGLFGPLHHMWSLAVEEQFYAVWPVALIVLIPLSRTRARLARIVIALAVAGLLIRWGGLLALGFQWAYHATLPNVFPLLAGAALAAVARLPDPRWSRLTGLGGAAILTAAAVAPLPGTSGWIIARTLAATAAMLLLLPRSDRWMQWAPLRYCGRISYGWYLWHVLFQFELGNGIGTAVSFLVAVLSWHLWESRWTRPSAKGASSDPPAQGSAGVQPLGEGDSRQRGRVAAEPEL